MTPCSGLIPMLERRKRFYDLINYINKLLAELAELNESKQTWLLAAQVKAELEQIKNDLDKRRGEFE